jgi:hypothetical protein
MLEYGMEVNTLFGFYGRADNTHKDARDNKIINFLL